MKVEEKQEVLGSWDLGVKPDSDVGIGWQFISPGSACWVESIGLQKLSTTIFEVSKRWVGL